MAQNIDIPGCLSGYSRTFSLTFAYERQNERHCRWFCRPFGPAQPSVRPQMLPTKATFRTQAPYHSAAPSNPPFLASVLPHFDLTKLAISTRKICIAIFVENALRKITRFRASPVNAENTLCKVSKIGLIGESQERTNLLKAYKYK
jgi:hypothetical protein